MVITRELICCLLLRFYFYLIVILIATIITLNTITRNNKEKGRENTIQCKKDPKKYKHFADMAWVTFICSNNDSKEEIGCIYEGLLKSI